MEKNKNIEEVKERLNDFKSIKIKEIIKGVSTDVFMVHTQQFTKIQNDVKILLEELDKKDRQLEEKTNRIKNLEKECQQLFDNMMDKLVENIKQEAMINETIKELSIFYNDCEPCCLKDVANIKCKEYKDCKDCIRQYFERKINNDKTIS